MSPADTLARSAHSLSILLRDTIHDRLEAATRGETMRADLLGEDVRAICDVITYESDIILGVRYQIVGDWLAECVQKCTCHGGGLGHEPGCGLERTLDLSDLARLVCSGCGECRPEAAAAMSLEVFREEHS